MQKTSKILVHALPIVLMVGLIPIVADDYVLALIYIGIAGVMLSIKRERHDVLVYFVGLVALTISEFFFIQTGVETFTRQSLFGVMPLWLPLLWAYGFVVMKRSLSELDR